jgi:CheY-like chemotaxis protein
MAKRILLADDSVTIQKVVELTFMDEDYEVVAVSNGDEALTRLAELQPDLVIADVHMPGASGYEVCRQAKQWRASTPVLLLVGTFEPFQEDEARRSGADAYIKKPFDSQELLRRAEELIAAASQYAPTEVTTTPSDEMDAWRAPEPDAAPEDRDLYGAEGAPIDEPSGPLGGHVMPDEMVLEASPWTEAEEGEAAISGAPALPQPVPSYDEPTVSMPRASSPATPPAAAVAPAAPATANGSLSEGDVDRIARRVVELLGERLVREVAWEVVPDMAELVIKDRLRELERQLEGP